MNCYFCQKNIKEINYRDVETLWKFISAFYKIRPRRKTGVCTKHQRKLSRTIKRARQMGLLPYTPK
ncbi:MAG: 30S ribosomal protein S18 [Candidatus Nealsonbacteria bacterium CG_4_9_14_0_2_um_filter_37_38]|uniref:Small ribosomal subunit protein bS18 n=1 Tax=Candidatus Nealsonbacteria bacterium CG_4_10_14_0_8_um_filter_37_14 TaxID=1974684 RepID=A0A2M7R6G7_9BACT|nr:MAG: 30S ribosomal protein S18 [Candidatus Nealsonbacteria bacterium CG11_big_fil_rev_8_21_14_0_20_37_68]PIW91862.1 MAG: 30S ribosomal protein S18 [Candidatus Nealsonbacteria bacterium CG_4_8_14_3_um_filter_37_23]PIY89204.1 MAG: 30S ribosomal protein S18 [Candidatus Nealsonbacteria bacterium CG_4_10_14_0_8_um_filter_37_14]PJC51604.1 MAG: 30S ribosomal protein S18 [Candidatus Nealsonbacteria bacterium CG_4_9_14_0_2_um_filter_37_38]